MNPSLPTRACSSSTNRSRSSRRSSPGTTSRWSGTSCLLSAGRILSGARVHSSTRRGRRSRSTISTVPAAIWHVRVRPMRMTSTWTSSSTSSRRRYESDERARRPFLEALRVEYEAAFQDDDLEAMARAADERAEVARGFDEHAHLTGLIASGRALKRAGRFDEALERIRYVWDEAERRVLPRLTLDAGYWLSALLLQRGRLAEAEEIVIETIELAARVGDEARGRHLIERVASEVDFHRADWRAGVERLLAYARTASEHARIELHQLAALWLALVGGEALTREVVEQVDAARACAEVANCPRCATELRLVAAEALVRVGRRADAARSLEEWERLQAHPRPRDKLTSRRVRALLTESDAPRLLESAIHDAEELGLVLDALWTRLALGTVLAETDRARA